MGHKTGGSIGLPFCFFFLEGVREKIRLYEEHELKSSVDEVVWWPSLSHIVMRPRSPPTTFWSVVLFGAEHVASSF